MCACQLRTLVKVLFDHLLSISKNITEALFVQNQGHIVRWFPEKSARLQNKYDCISTCLLRVSMNPPHAAIKESKLCFFPVPALCMFWGCRKSFLNNISVSHSHLFSLVFLTNQLIWKWTVCVIVCLTKFRNLLKLLDSRDWYNLSKALIIMHHNS